MMSCLQCLRSNLTYGNLTFVKFQEKNPYSGRWNHLYRTLIGNTLVNWIGIKCALQQQQKLCFGKVTNIGDGWDILYQYVCIFYCKVISNSVHIFFSIGGYAEAQNLSFGKGTYIGDG